MQPELSGRRDDQLMGQAVGFTRQVGWSHPAVVSNDWSCLADREAVQDHPYKEVDVRVIQLARLAARKSCSQVNSYPVAGAQR